MSELSTLARPYAVAAFRRAKETGTTQQWSDALDFLTAVLSDQRIIKAAMHPTVRREDFVAAFLSLCSGVLHQESENFVRLLIHNKRLHVISSVASLFKQYRAEDEGYVEVEVESAFPLDDQEKRTLSTVLDHFLGKEARITIITCPELIGGVYIRAGDRVIDASIRGQIERIAKRLCH